MLYQAEEDDLTQLWPHRPDPALWIWDSALHAYPQAPSSQGETVGSSFTDHLQSPSPDVQTSYHTHLTSVFPPVPTHSMGVRGHRHILLKLGWGNQPSLKSNHGFLSHSCAVHTYAILKTSLCSCAPVDSEQSPGLQTNLKLTSGMGSQGWRKGQVILRAQWVLTPVLPAPCLLRAAQSLDIKFTFSLQALGNKYLQQQGRKQLLDQEKKKGTNPIHFEGSIISILVFKFGSLGIGLCCFRI